MFDLPAPIAVVCNDAGSANIIIAWIREYGTSNLRVFVQGPARELWLREFPIFPISSTLDDALDDAQSLLSGTGWSSHIEHEARIIASNKKIKSVAVIDHWVNYESRFERNGKIQLPDQIWVTDEYAVTLAEKKFENLHVELKRNLYLEKQLANITPAPKNGTILILLEPTRSTWGRLIEGEFQFLDYVYRNLASFCEFKINKIRLRPHPSDQEGKYNNWIMNHDLVELDVFDDVCAAISASDLIIGIESFALTIALGSGRPVYTGLPPWAPEFRLPHKGIKQIRNILQ